MHAPEHLSENLANFESGLTSGWLPHSYFTNRGYAFQSRAWFAADLVYVHLQTCHRVGAHEKDFVERLCRLRCGAFREKDVDVLNAAGKKKHSDDQCPTEIWPTNAKVNAINKAGLDKIALPMKRFEFQTWVRPFKNIPSYARPR